MRTVAEIRAGQEGSAGSGGVRVDRGSSNQLNVWWRRVKVLSEGLKSLRKEAECTEFRIRHSRFYEEERTSVKVVRSHKRRNESPGQQVRVGFGEYKKWLRALSCYERMAELLIWLKVSCGAAATRWVMRRLAKACDNINFLRLMINVLRSV